MRTSRVSGRALTAKKSQPPNDMNKDTDTKTPKTSPSAATCGSGRLSRRTPEQEAFRLMRLREVMKKPRSEEWKQKQSEGARRAYADGRFNHLHTPETRQKVAAKLRGRKRSKEVVEKIAARLRGRKCSPDVVAAMRQRVVEGFKQGRYKTPPEKRAEVNRKLSIANTGRKHTEEQNHRHSEVMSGREWSPEVIKKRADGNVGVRRKPPHAARGPQNRCAVVCEFRSPTNVIWLARNITHFVRTHPQLFSAEDVQWYGEGRAKSARCRALKGLLKLRESKDPRGSWKGWTLYSDTEHYKNGGDDLLHRKTCPNEKLSD